MKRDIYLELQAWKTSKRRKPLILRGARQVGKTTILKAFGQTEYKQMVYFNFEEDPALGNLFLGKLNAETLLNHLRIYSNHAITSEDTLIIFDEIQECPQALTSLKYFQEEAPEYAIIAAGSLLGVKLANTTGFPVGKVHFLDLYPLNFFEFLSALDRESLRQFLETLHRDAIIPAPIHNELLELLKYYLFIGGMPEVVAEFAASRDLQQVRIIQNDILRAYELDFAKHAPSNEIMKISILWHAIPQQLAKENKKFIFSALATGARAREYEIALQWLIDAGLVYKSQHIATPKLPLGSYMENNAFKLFMVDVGLLGALSRLPAQVLIAGSQLFLEFKGSFTENYVAQALIPQEPHQLYYWTSGNTAEVDFIMPHEHSIYPLEVKSGFSTKQKSLRFYTDKYNPPISTRTNLQNLTCADNFYNLPLYLISRFPGILV